MIRAYFPCLHLAFSAWLLGKPNLCAAWHWLDYNIFIEFLFFSAIFLMVVMISVFGDFPLFFVFCFVFPQGSELFWKCCVISFVGQISCRACTVYLAPFSSPSEHYFLLVITSTFLSSLLDGWRWDLFLLHSLLCLKIQRSVLDIYYVFNKYMLRQWIKVSLRFLF